MTKKICWLICLLLICSATSKNSGEDIQPAALLSPPAIMPVDQIRIGMTGYGQTVFKGTEIEKFDVEVIAVYKNVLPKHDMILIKCKHPATDHAGIIAGMSGSPIYIVEDPAKEPAGRLIGALAYGWSFTKDSIAGVTPIQEMLNEMNKPLEKNQSGYYEPDFSDKKLANSMDIPSGQMVPLKTPLFVSGVKTERMKELESILNHFNLVPVQAGGISADLQETMNHELLPGSAVGVTLVRGDLDWSAIGTITYRSDDKILAFGHPFMGWGELTAPLTTAYIYGTMASSAMSFKLGASVKEVGKLTQDRTSAIAGLMNQNVRMIPVKISVANVATDSKQTFNYEILNNRQLLPVLIYYMMAASVDITEPSPETATVEITSRIKISGLEPFVFKRVISNISSGAGLSEVSRIIWPLWHNPYFEPAVEEFAFDLKVLNKNTTAAIKNIWLEKTEVAPDEQVELNITLKPYKQPEITRKISFLLPAGIPDQDITVTLTGGNYLMPSLPKPRNMEEMLKYLQSFYESRDLIAVIPLKETNLKYRGHTLRNLPNSVISQMLQQSQEPVTVSPDAASGYHYPEEIGIREETQLSRNSLRIFQPTEYLIEGTQSTVLKVRRK